MIAALFFLLILIGAIVAIAVTMYNIAFPKVDWVESTFIAPLKRGTLTAEISHDPSDRLEIKRALNRWALRLTNLENLDDALQGILPHTRVISVATEGTELPPEKPAKPSLADSLVRDLKAKQDASKAIAEEAGIEVDITGKVQGYTKDRINDLFHHPDRA